MWNPSQTQEEDDESWEVRAFAQDTGNILGATWPPRSYTCTFCRREFRSAQALGGHMNVHRRDRARLHQPTQTPHPMHPPSSSSSSTLIIPTQEFPTNGGFGLLYQLPPPSNTNVNPIFSTTKANGSVDSTSTLPSISPHNWSNSPRVFTSPQSVNAPLLSSDVNSSYRDTAGVRSSSYGDNSDSNNIGRESETEEIDLELRLGHG